MAIDKPHKARRVFGLLALVFALSTITALVVVLITGRSSTDSSCAGVKTTSHTITIKDGRAEPSTTAAAQCDSLTITNQDNVHRIMAFGEHDAHTSYNGISEKVLGKDESFTVTLVQAGNFRIHDHNDDSVASSFTVSAR